MGAAATRTSPAALWAALVALLLAVVLSPLLLVLLATTVDGGGQGGAVDDIPAEYLVLYRAAGQRYGLDWAILAALGKIETDHGRSTAPGVHSGVNFAGCCAGPMQFNVRDGTWDTYGAGGDVYDPSDAIPAAARKLRHDGAPRDYRRAIYAYNHADWYVDQVLDQAAAYRTAATDAPSDIDAPGAELAVRTVLANRRITLTAAQRGDILAGRISGKLLGLLAWVGTRHSVIVTALYSDHAAGTNHRPSDWSKGRAMDVGNVDRQRCLNYSPESPCGRLAHEVLAVRGPLHPTEVICWFDPDGSASADGFARADHDDHVHIGYDA